MSETKPFATCSVTKDNVTMDCEGTCLYRVIKTEKVDIKPDYIECNTDIKKEKTNIDEQTDDCDPLVDAPNDISSSASMDAHTNIETRNEILSTHGNDNSEIYHGTQIEIEIFPDIVTYDELELSSSQEIPSDSNTDTKIEEMDESDTDMFLEEDDMYITEASSAEIEPKAGTSNTSDYKKKSNQKHKTFKCKMCSYKCVKRSNIVEHLRIHTGEKPFSCEFCDYKASLKANLTRHLRLHTGEKPFSCKFCDYKSAVKISLTRHLRTHTGEKPFNCEFCDYKCARKTHLTRHLKHHTGEKSNIHSTTHTSEKTSCKFCDPKVNSHLKKHTGDKPVPCNFCNDKFSVKAILKKCLTDRIVNGSPP